MSRDYRMFMTGVVVGSFGTAFLDTFTVPWWLGLMTWVVGIWVLFDLARAWWRASDVRCECGNEHLPFGMTKANEWEIHTKKKCTTR